MNTHFVDFSPGGFFRHYWPSFVFVIVAWALGIVAIITLNLSNGQSPFVYFYGLVALVRAIWAGWRPDVSGGVSEKGCLAMVMSIGVMVVAWPLAELWWQGRFLWKARSHWQKNEILIFEGSNKPAKFA